MTQPAAAEIQIVHAPQLSLRALIGRRRLTTTCLSSLASTVDDGGHHAAKSGSTKAIIRGQQTDSLTSATGGVAAGSDSPAGAVDDGAGQGDRNGSGR